VIGVEGPLDEVGVRVVVVDEAGDHLPNPAKYAAIP
jgi:hypothetical protein